MGQMATSALDKIHACRKDQEIPILSHLISNQINVNPPNDRQVTSSVKVMEIREGELWWDYIMQDVGFSMWHNRISQEVTTFV